MGNRTIAVLGPNNDGCTQEISEFGYLLGYALSKGGYSIVCGGMGGLMEAVCKGAAQNGGIPIVGILPGDDIKAANPYCNIVIPTGLGIARNKLVVATGDVVIAVGGGAGTLSEIAMAWQLKKKVICITGLGGWSDSLAGKILDRRSTNPITACSSVEEVLKILNCV